MKLEVHGVAIDVIRMLRGAVREIRKHDPDLARQIRRAASSIPLNIAEGARRQGRDRVYHFTVAAGSADETRAGLDVANAWGDLDEEVANAIDAQVDRVLAMLYRMTH